MGYEPQTVHAGMVMLMGVVTAVEDDDDDGDVIVAAFLVIGVGRIMAIYLAQY